MRFAEMVADEIARARSIHAPMHSAHEAYAVIKEELDEFWEEVRKKRVERSKIRMLRDLVQIGAMVQRAAEDVGLMDSQGGE